MTRIEIPFGVCVTPLPHTLSNLIGTITCHTNFVSGLTLGSISLLLAWRRLKRPYMRLRTAFSSTLMPRTSVQSRNDTVCIFRQRLPCSYF